ncbi:MAG TPA: ABC transporter permease [Pyrinomonadaceae bacterium]|jgi:putative ABC transport system permease protein|nr:ABC transporter permease [Pyrinomonadaceae bacterium]
MLTKIWHDLRYAARMLRNKPGFTAVAIITLSLGIGANTAIFSVVNAVLLRPLPFPKPENIVLVRDNLSGRQTENVGMSVDELNDLQERSGVFEQVSAVWPIDANLTGSDRPERIEVLAVSPNYFSLLGAGAQIGRIFGPQDQAAGFAEGAVISDGLWRNHFGSDPNVLGRKVYMDSDLYTIVGVMPAGFRHPGQTLRNEVEMWATAGYSANPFGPPVRGQRLLPGAIARIKPELSLPQAQAKLDAFVANLHQEFPKDYPPEAGWTVKLLPARESLVGNVQTTLLMLLAAVGLVLLIGCVNIANLLLARSSGRQREMAIRLAMGAGRGRLILQLLTESLLLSFIGGIVALLIVSSLKTVLLGLVPADTPRLNEVGVNAGVLVFVFLISTLTGLLFGLIPALQASRPDLVINLKEGSQGAGSGARHHRFRSGLVVVEFALSLMLMIAAGLLLRSFGRLMEVDPGFDSSHVLLARIWLPVPNNPERDPYRPTAKRAAFVKEVLRRTSALPGVQYAAVGGGGGVPLMDQNKPGVFTIEDQPTTDANLPRTKFSSVSADYFRVLGTPLISGRFFAPGDDEEAPRVALIDEALAHRFFPNTDPIGRHVKPGPRDSKAPWLRIMGVVGNIKTEGFDQPDQPHLYVPILQNPGYAMAVYVRTEGNPAGLTQSLRQEVQAVDPNLPLFGERTMDDLVSASLGQRRFAMQVVGLFGVLALFLAGIGIYGVMAYSVTQRTREIGIRLALGASTGNILGWLLQQGMRLTLIGMGVGLLGALALTRLLRGLLFGIAPTDLVTYAGLTVLLAGVALLACYIPARRATKVDPLVALRYE